jgi:hypothetical protein
VVERQRPEHLADDDQRENRRCAETGQFYTMLSHSGRNGINSAAKAWTAGLLL